MKLQVPTLLSKPTEIVLKTCSETLTVCATAVHVRPVLAVHLGHSHKL